MKYLSQEKSFDLSKNVYFLINTLFFLHVGFIGSTYILFFFDNGLEELVTNVVSAFFALSVFIFEIPSGAYSDIFGNRKAVLYGSLLLIFSMLIFSTGTTISMFIVAQIIWGLSYALISGALESWVIKQAKLQKEELQKLFITSNKFSNISMIVAGLIGGMLGNMSLRLPWILSLISAITCFTLAYFFINEKNCNTTIVKKLSFKVGINEMKKVVVKSKDFITSNQLTRYLIIFNLILGFFLTPIFTYWSPYFYELTGNRVWILGWIWVIIKISNYGGNEIVQLLNSKNINRNLILLTSIISISIALIIAAVTRNFGIVLLMFITFETILGIIQPIQQSYLNQSIPEEERATLLSFNSMISQLGRLASLLVMGSIAQLTTISTTWLVAGIGTFTTIILLKMINNPTFDVQ